jgi:hypothetical protein
MLLMLSDAHLANGAPKDAMVAGEAALAAATRQQELWLEPELHRHRERISRESYKS